MPAPDRNIEKLRNEHRKLLEEQDALSEKDNASRYTVGTERRAQDLSDREKQRSRELPGEVAAANAAVRGAEQEYGAASWLQLSEQEDYRTVVCDAALAWAERLEPFAALQVTQRRAGQHGVHVPPSATIPRTILGELRTFASWVEHQPAVDAETLPAALRALIAENLF
ncbi:MAG: hypothetical protein AB7F65_02850 [Dehalococcoidia bacterium]